MGRRITLEVKCPKNVRGIVADPVPDWSFDDLLLELNELENKLTHSSKISLSSTKADSGKVSKSKNREVPNSKDKNGVSRAFVMRVSYKDMEIDDHLHDKAMVVGRRFTCGDLVLSDSEDSEDELMTGFQTNLMPHVGFVEGALSELTNDRQFATMEEIRSQVMDLEMSLANENEKFAYDLGRTEKYAETKRELDRKFDMQYQRRIAEALDNHLTALQRDHEHKSQIEERKIRDDAVREEAQRRERALYEEKVRQEKIEAEAQMRAKLEAERAEAARATILEAERKAAEEAARNRASTSATTPAAGDSETSSEATAVSQGSLTQVTRSAESTGDLIKSTHNALELEKRRLQAYEEVAVKNHELKISSHMDFSEHERNIKRNIRTMRASEDSVRAKASELLNLINHPSVPQSISIMTLVDMIVSQCNKPIENRSLYAYGRIIVLFSSKVPLTMDMLIAKLNSVCIYTVPKHISYSKSVFETNEAYFKAIGFGQGDNGKIENVDDFLERMASCMKLYGALVQTEVRGIQNLHGLEEGWAWLTRFLNALPPNLYTAVALGSFLEMSGYAMYKRFRNQFIKLVDIIDQGFLEALQDELKTTPAVQKFRNYLRSNEFTSEPKDRELTADVLSRSFV